MRKLIGVLGILVYLTAWIALAAWIGTFLTNAPKALELIYYIFAGLAWVIPLRWVFRWMNANDLPPPD